MAEQRLTYKIYFDAESGTATLRGLDGTIKATTVSTKKLREEYGNFATQIKATDTEIQNLTRGKDGKGGMQGMSNATGSATAAALELGRVVSDAPYGIRGMANNVSQLASNLVFMASATNASTGAAIGFTGAIKNMWAALKGPLGVLLAIQTVIAAIDYFAGSTKKAKEEVDGLNESIEKQVQQFNVLKNIIEGIADIRNPLSQFTDEEAIIILRDTFDELDKKLKELEKTGKATPEAVDDLISKYGKLLETRRLIAITEQQLAEASTLTDREAYQTRLIGLQLYKIELEKLFELEKKTGSSRNKQAKEYKANLLDLSSELQSFRQKEIENADLTEEERLKREYDASRKAVENKRLEYKDKEDARLDARLKEIDDLKITEEEKQVLIQDAYDKYNAAQIQANEELRSVMLQADIAYYSELAALRRQDTEDAKKQTDDLIEAIRDSNYEYQEYNAQQKINAATNELDRIKAEEEANTNLTNLKVENLKKEAQQKGKSAADIQEINNEISRLQHDQTLYQEELDRRAAATKLAIANQVADAIINIAGEGSGIAKGVAIAQTIWNTKQGVMAALGAAPYGPWNIAQAAAVAAMGIKNVADIINTKAPNEKSSGVSTAGAGGGPTFMPEFNIVGASGQNQLASTIAGQVGEPTRAYVVYDDLRTAGEIEANAVTAAGI
jgi:hypothetical protein